MGSGAAACSAHRHPACKEGSSNPRDTNCFNLAPSPERNLVPGNKIRLGFLGLKFSVYPQAPKM